MRRLRPGSWTLLRKFTVLSLMCFAVLGVVLSQLLANGIRERALSNTVQSAELLSGTLASSELRPADMTGPMDPARMRALDKAVAQAQAQHRIARMKVWSREGRIVYSDDHRAIGKEFDVEKDLGEALGGETHSDVSSGQAAEQQGERGLGKLLEAYVPLRFSAAGQPAGAFEIYVPYAPVEAAAARDVHKVYAAVAAGLTLLFLLLYRIVGRASRSLRRQAEENRRQALHDPLTGLPNRRSLYERLDDQLEESRRRERPLALLVADLDGFKELNDTLGHHAGDVVLSQLGPRVQAAVPGVELLARIGGDEFAVLTFGDAADAAERFRSALDEPFVVDGISLTVQASIGIARAPEHGDDAHALMQRADVAMYQAKSQQLGWLEYEAQRDEHSRTRLELAGELRRAISEGELVVHYQPKADLERGQVISVEALVRWQHPTHGLLAPGDFVPMAEQTGQIRPLTLYVLEAAARQAREWEDMGLDLVVAVNLAMANLIDSQLPDDVAALLAKHRLAPRRLILEITENVVMADPARTLQILERLRSLGVGLSLDDFGTGHSSLAYLRQLQVDELKIDRSFVTNMVRDEQNAAIVRSTIDLAHAVGVRIVAEGVEDADTLFELKAMGADEAQGFYLSKPVPPTEILAMLMHTFRREESAEPRSYDV